MGTQSAVGDTRLLCWRRVREFAVPPSMIEAATARRLTGDWAGACAAARVDVDLDLRRIARTHGRELAGRVRADLRRLAPDLLRWHLPRILPDGLLRPGVTVALAGYPPEGEDAGADRILLVARTPPAWAAGGQRFSLALWDGGPGPSRLPRSDRPSGSHPHPHPARRFRLDLHRHLWDAGRSGELRFRCGADRTDPVEHWSAEARILLRAERRPPGPVEVRLGGRRRLLLTPDGDVLARNGRPDPRLPLLPDAATWTPPDPALLRAGLIEPGRLHPLVAAALAPDAPCPRAGREPAGRGGLLVDCRGAQHRIALVDGRLTAVDHPPEEIRREELLAALTGTPLPCLRVIDRAHRTPQELDAIRERLRHGDSAGALAAVEELLGADALLREGPLLDALEGAVRDRLAHGLFRAGLVPAGLVRASLSPAAGAHGGHREPRRRESRSRPRQATAR